jgi:hypothetical protein
LVIAAKSEREMKEMMKTLRKYVTKKELFFLIQVNAENTKMMVLSKRKRKKSKENEWNWEGRKIERVKEFKFLGYTFNERTMDKAHIRQTR